MNAPRLVIRKLNKSYASPVLRDVNLSLGAGEVHAVVGENGAGKSTLVNILAGLTTADSGELWLDGEQYNPLHPTDAFEKGVSLAAQELSSISTLTVSENLHLRALPTTNGIVDRHRLVDSAATALRVVGLGERAADTLVTNMTLAERQLLEFAKATLGDPDLLILDEPTAALTQPQADRLHALIRERASNGATVIYISHRLEDVLDIADVISVLRDGRLVNSDRSSEFTVDELVQQMAGDAYSATSPGASNRGSELLRIVEVTTKELRHPVDLTIHAGEVVGLAGLEGAGRSALLHAAFGLSPLTDGNVHRITGDGHVSIRSPGRAVAAGVAMLGEDRQTMGIYPGQSVRFNMMLPGKKRAVSDTIDGQSEIDSTTALIEQLAIRCTGSEQSITELSGGNQQKVLLARWLHCDSQVFLLDEPTRGIDVATKGAVYALLRDLVKRNAGIAIASSDIEELMTVCDRIVVLADGRIVREFLRHEWSEADILAAAFSAHVSARTH